MKSMARIALLLLITGCRPPGTGPLPRLLSQTGLKDPRVVGFTPRYPLWTDGAEKQRFIRVPDGTAVEAADVEHFTFPIGTQLWKHFSFGGRKIETRYIER